MLFYTALCCGLCYPFTLNYVGLNINHVLELVSTGKTDGQDFRKVISLDWAINEGLFL